MNNNNLSYELLYYDSKIPPEELEKLKKIPINQLYSSIRVVIDKPNNFIIKFINKIDVDSKLNNEIFIAKEILKNKFVNKHVINIHGIFKIIKNKLDDTTFDLLTYKEKISPAMQNINKNKKNDVYGIVMPIYETLEDYISDIDIINPNILLSNILGILDLMIYVRDRYKFIHSDIKIHNILVKDDVFYVIDWEDIMEVDTKYYHKERPLTGNTEMYPFYDATAEEFFIYSIGVLIVRILGYQSNITYKTFLSNLNIFYILSEIPIIKTLLYEDIIIRIFNRKYSKIENLREDVYKLLTKYSNG
jgi:hypothetical protein